MSTWSSTSSWPFTPRTSGDRQSEERAAEQHEERERLEGTPRARGAEVVTEEADPDQDAGERVDHHEGRLRRRDGPGVEGVLGEEQRESNPQPASE